MIPVLPLLLRLTLGSIMIAHGYSKLMNGPTEAWGNFFASLGIIAPVVMAWAVTIVEFAGGIFVISGFLTRLASLLFSGVMLGAIILVSYELGLKSTAQGPGADLNFALLAASLALFVIGPGKFSLDTFLGLENEKIHPPQTGEEQEKSMNELYHT